MRDDAVLKRFTLNDIFVNPTFAGSKKRPTRRRAPRAPQATQVATQIDPSVGEE